MLGHEGVRGRLATSIMLTAAAAVPDVLFPLLYGFTGTRVLALLAQKYKY
jgi:hypothetical protein